MRQFHETLDRTPSSHHELAELAVMRVLDLKDDLENGDSSNAGILMEASEADVRKYIGNTLRDKAFGRYNIPQEEELADAKKPDDDHMPEFLPDIHELEKGFEQEFGEEEPEPAAQPAPPPPRDRG